MDVSIHVKLPERPAHLPLHPARRDRVAPADHLDPTRHEHLLEHRLARNPYLELWRPAAERVLLAGLVTGPRVLPGSPRRVAALSQSHGETV